MTLGKSLIGPCSEGELMECWRWSSGFVLVNMGWWNTPMKREWMGKDRILFEFDFGEGRYRFIGN